MAIGDHGPQILMIRPPIAFTLFPSLFQQKFRILSAWESELPLDQFLTTNAHLVQALVTNDNTVINAETLRLLPALRLVAATTAGVDNIDLAECRRLGIAVTNNGSAYAEDAADFAIGLLIDVFRRVSASDRYLRKGFWKGKGDYPLGFKCIVRYPRSQKVTSRIGKFQFGGKRIGIVGFGKIGSEVAKRLEAFGCNVLYNSRNEVPSVSYPFYSSIRDLAENSDAIVLCCSLTTETRQIVDKEVLSALGKNGVIVNVGRGALIDEKELVRCLVAREIGGAGLDVFENEPNVPEDLFALDNVVLSPHVAAFTPESFEAAAEFVVANLEAFFSNKPLLSPITID